MLPRGKEAIYTDPYRQDGVSLDERIEGMLISLRARLAGLSERFTRDLPDAGALSRQFQGDAQSLADDQRAAVLSESTARKASGIGRFMRGIVTTLVLLWFPLLQPILETVLASLDTSNFSLTEALHLLVSTLSGSAVLSGLCVSLLLLAMMTATVYSRAVRDAHSALSRLQALTQREGAGALCGAAVHSATRSLKAHEQTLARTCEQLDAYLNGPGSN